MTTCQTIAIDFDDEMASTRQLLERVPLDDAHRGYRPHEKSTVLDRLATHVADLPSWLKMALESQVFELQPGFKPRIAASTAELLEIFDKSVAEAHASIASATEEDMEKTGHSNSGIRSPSRRSARKSCADSSTTFSIIGHSWVSTCGSTESRSRGCTVLRLTSLGRDRVDLIGD